MRRMVSAVTLLAVALLVSNVHADGECCPIKAGMSKLPKITFNVGEEATCCAQTAAKLAEKSGESITYAVAGQKFDSRATALVALADATDEFVAKFAKPHTCSVSGKTTVAGKELSCCVKADKTAKLVKKAMDNVAMTYLVGKTECNCPVEAEKLSKQADEKTIFVVAGQETCCGVTARLNLAKAKYRAALEALAKSAQEESADSDS